MYTHRRKSPTSNWSIRWWRNDSAICRKWCRFRNWWTEHPWPWSCRHITVRCKRNTNRGNDFVKPTSRNSKSIHCAGVVNRNPTKRCPWRTGTSQSVCVLGTKTSDGRVKKIDASKLLFHIFDGLKKKTSSGIHNDRRWYLGPQFLLLKKKPRTHKHQISPGVFLVYLKVQYFETCFA